MNNHMRRAIHLFLLLVIGQISHAQFTDQNYPVTSTAFIAAQPNQKLSTYFASDRALTVTLLLKDLTKSSVQVYLRWSLDGPGVRISSLDGYIPANFITLDRGMPRRLSGLELQNDYFRQHLLQEEGLRGTALRTNLPEGFYTFRVQALEAGTGREVSNLGETYFSVTTPLPPVVNLPFNGADVAATGIRPPSIQWMPRHYRLPGHTTVYDLLVCKIPDGMEPTEAIEACVNPIVDDRGNPGTLYPANTGIGNSPVGAFDYGARYAVRVQVREFDASGEPVLFANQGYSEVTWFRYGGACASPEDVTITPTGPGRVLLSWRSPPAYTGNGYQVFYRAAGSAKWTSGGETATTSLTLPEHLQGMEGPYQFTVLAGCQPDPDKGDVYTWQPEEDPEDGEPLPPLLVNPLATVVTVQCGGAATADPMDYYALDTAAADSLRKIPDCALHTSSFSDCSLPHPVITPETSGIPLNTLQPGDVLGIYDFAVFITQAALDGNGGFSGKGLVRLPFLGNALAPAEFTGIKAWKQEGGGCVYESAGFRVISTSQAEAARMRAGWLAVLSGQTGEGTFAGTLAEALAGYDSLASNTGAEGRCAYTAAILDVTRQLTDLLDDVGEGEDEAERIANGLKELMASLESGQPVDSLSVKYQDLLARLDALVKQAIAEQQQHYALYNVRAGGITQQTARLSWEPEGDFDRYVIQYAGPEGALLQQTVTSPMAELGRLGTNTAYSYRILAYKGSEQKASYEGVFQTLAHHVPPPENLDFTATGERSVRITWDQNPLHHSYRLEYTDDKGQLRTVYPVGNQAVLEGLAPDRYYDYQVVAYDNARTSSDPASSQFHTGCVLMIQGYNRVIAGESLSLSAHGCQSSLDSLIGDMNAPGISIRWSTPEGVAEGMRIVTSPMEDFTYTAVCFDETGRENCRTEMKVKVDKKCSEVMATAYPLSVDQGQPVMLRSTGCEGTVEWRAVSRGTAYPGTIVGRERNLLVYPTKNTTYFMACNDTDGNQCMAKTGEVLVDCALKLAVTNRSDYTPTLFGLFKDFNKKVEVQATGCSGTVTWKRDGGSSSTSEEITFDSHTITYKSMKKSFSVTATCLENGCKTTVDIEVPPTSNFCKGENSFKIERIEEKEDPDRLTLKLSSEHAFKWDDDGSNHEIRKIPLPNTTAVFSATMEQKKCITAYAFNPDRSPVEDIPCHIFSLGRSGNTQIPHNSASTTLTFVASGCQGGETGSPIEWVLVNQSDGTEKRLVSTDRTQKLIFSNSDANKEFQIKARCMLTGVESSMKFTITKQSAPTTNPNSPTVLRNPCGFYPYTRYESADNTFLFGEPVEIRVFGGDFIQAFIEGDRHRIANGISTSKENGEDIITVNTGYGQDINGAGTYYGSFRIRIINNVPGVGVCSTSIAVRVHPDRSNNPYVNPAPINVDFSKPRTKESCEKYALGGKEIPVIRRPKGQTLYALQHGNSLLSFGVVSLYDDYIGRVYDGSDPEQIGLVDKVCHSQGGVNIEWFRNRSGQGLSNPMPIVRDAGYLMGLENTPDFNNSRKYYSRCTFNDGTFCVNEVTVDPKMSSNARLAAPEAPSEQTESASVGCVYSVKEAVVMVLADLLCEKLSLLEGNEAEKLEAARQEFQALGVDLAPITPQMISDLQAGQCRSVAQALSAPLTGHLPVSELNSVLVNKENIDRLFSEITDQLLAELFVCSGTRKGTLTFAPGVTVLKKYPVWTIDGAAYEAFWLEDKFWRFIRKDQLPESESERRKLAVMEKLDYLPERLYTVSYSTVSSCNERAGEVIDDPSGTGYLTEAGRQELRRHLNRYGYGDTEVTIKACGEDNSHTVTAGSDATTPGQKPIRIEMCWDGAQWQVTHSFAPGTLKIPAGFEGSAAEVEQISNQYVDKVKVDGIPAFSNEELTYTGLDFLKAIIEVKEATLSLCNAAKIPEKYWEPSLESPVKAPTLSGVGDGAIQELKDIPELVGFGLQLATEPETAKALWDGMKSLTPDKVKKMLLGAAQEKLDKYAQGGDVMKHEAGKDGVAAAMFIYGAVKSISTNASKIADLGDDVVKKLDDIAVESLDEISGAIDQIGGKSFNKALKEAEFDNFIAESYSSTVADVAKTKGRKLSWEEVQALFKRGNDFNAKARIKYGDNRVEVVLKGVDGKAGKRLDTYLPPSNGNPGQIISRKATTLSEIQPSTFRSYLDEIITKYPKGAELNSSKFPPGTKLDGDYKLEIPKSNESFFNNSTEFQNVLNDFNTSRGVNIEIIYLIE